MTTTTCSWRPYRVALRTQECRGVISLYLEPTDGALPPAFAAGQYVELRMPGIEPHAFFLVGPSGDRLVRLTIEVGDEPFIGEVGRIAKLRIGDPVELSEPKGELAMEPGETPVVIMTEDIGASSPTHSSPKWPRSSPCATSVSSASSPTAPACSCARSSGSSSI